MANEKRLIDADAFLGKLSKLAELMRQGKIGEIDINLLIASTPTVDAVEVVHGRWEEDKPPEHYIFTGVNVIYRCSECNNRFIHDTHYCPNCGAQMDGGDEDDHFCSYGERREGE